MFFPHKDKPVSISGYLFAAVVAAAVWLKFLSVDYAVADVLSPSRRPRSEPSSACCCR